MRRVLDALASSSKDLIPGGCPRSRDLLSKDQILDPCLSPCSLLRWSQAHFLKKQQKQAASLESASITRFCPAPILLLIPEWHLARRRSRVARVSVYLSVAENSAQIDRDQVAMASAAPRAWR
jgi:hypothetical protein